MSLSFPTSSLKTPSGVTALPSGFKRPAFGTLYGFDAQGGGGGASGFNIDIRDTEATIFARTGDATGTIAFGTDTYDLYVYDGSAWQIYNDTPVAPAYSNSASVEFDGTDDDFYLDSALSFSGEFTFSMWFKHSSGNYPYLLGGYLFVYGSSFGLKVLVRSLGTITSATNAYSMDTWHHAAYIRDSSNNTTLYLDGSSIGTSSSSATATVRQFAKNGAWEPLGGKMDEIALWDSDQTSNLATIYNSGVPADLSGLSPTNWYRMGDINSSSGTTIADQGSGGVDGELRNGPTYSTDVPS